jgi:hypothetical protein
VQPLARVERLQKAIHRRETELAPPATMVKFVSLAAICLQMPWVRSLGTQVGAQTRWSCGDDLFGLDYNDIA